MPGIKNLVRYQQNLAADNDIALDVYKRQTQEHVVVPDLAIVKRAGSGDRYVYVYKDGKVSYNKVELGRRCV